MDSWFCCMGNTIFLIRTLFNLFFVDQNEEIIFFIFFCKLTEICNACILTVVYLS